MSGYLYRHYDEWGRLLYVGASIEPHSRTRSHFRASRWAGVIGRIEMLKFASKEAAFDAEKAAIRDECPPYNIAGVPRVTVLVEEFDGRNEDAVSDDNISVKDAVWRCGNKQALADLLGVTKQAVSAWGDKLPPLRVFQLRQLRPGWFRRKS